MLIWVESQDLRAKLLLCLSYDWSYVRPFCKCMWKVYTYEITRGNLEVTRRIYWAFSVLDLSIMNPRTTITQADISGVRFLLHSLEFFYYKPNLLAFACGCRKNFQVDWNTHWTLIFWSGFHQFTLLPLGALTEGSAVGLIHKTSLEPKFLTYTTQYYAEHAEQVVSHISLHISCIKCPPLLSTPPR